jgi:hypothetical protein
MNVDTIEWFEVVWTLAALPGLILWLVNRAYAARSLKAIRALGTTNGRLIIARYSVMKSNVLIGVSLVFVLIGVISMIRPASFDGFDPLRLVLTLGLLGAPAAISYLGYRWRAVERQVTALARKILDSREVVQNHRETEQNHRETEQNDREKWQSHHDHEHPPQ